MSKTYERKAKQQKVEEELEGDVEVSQDGNEACFLDNSFKIGHKNNMNWGEVYQSF